MKRIQRKRTKGFRLPPNTLVITRGTELGNPFKMKDESDRDRVVIQFAEWIRKPEQYGLRELFIWTCENTDVENIACWCSLEQPCHGDVWIEIWNEYKKGDE